MPSVYAETTKLIDVKAKKTTLVRGNILEVQIVAEKINENTTANFVFDGKEYFADGGGGACRSDNGTFIGWIEDTTYPIARIICTIPMDVPKGVKTVELIAYQFRECDNGEERCSLVKSSQTFTLEDLKDDEETTPENEETIRDKVTKEKGEIQELLEILFDQYKNPRENEDGNDEGDGNDSGDSGNTPTTAPAEPPPTTINTDCNKFTDPIMKYTCQVQSEIKQVCTQYGVGQVLPENRICIDSVTSLTSNAKAIMKENAKLDYNLRPFGVNTRVQCPVGPAYHSRGLQCMGFAQGIFSAVKNNMPASKNPFYCCNVPPETVGSARIKEHFTQSTLSQCRAQVKKGEAVWFIWPFHIAIGSFLGDSGNTVQIYEGNFDYCGTTKTRNIDASAQGVTHCLIPKKP
jgi:hypothetical protein